MTTTKAAGALAITKDEGKKRIQDLVQDYRNLFATNKVDEFSEADVGSKFVLELLEALGWDTKNIDEVKEQKRTLTGAVDYSINVNKKSTLLLEIKGFDVKGGLDGYYTVRGKKETFPEQAIRYGWWLRVEWVILTDFKEIRLYNSFVRKPVDGLRLKLRYDEYLEKFDELWKLSRESVLGGVLSTLEAKKERKNVDEEILDDLLTIREKLTRSISKHNSLSTEQIRESVQMIMDRLIVIRAAEDRDILGFESLYKDFDAWQNRGLSTPFMRNLKGLFRDFDEIYNTKLFDNHPCEDLKIDNGLLDEIIQSLYKYNFDLIPSDLLGAIYEDYLGHILTDSQEGLEIVASQKIRKKEGVYYTPTYIVEYTVRKTLGNVLEEHADDPDKTGRIRVLDSACGSGSFLIKSFDVIEEWYDRYNERERGKRKSIDEHLRKIVTDSKQRILENNIFGVDLDGQAAEIASVNLMLKAIEKDRKLPQILGVNIKVGNSLITPSDDLQNHFNDLSKVKAFDWQGEFRDIFENGRFDVIVGNPPHGAELSTEERQYYAQKYETNKSYKNTASLFIERSYQLLKEGGIMGLVIPKSLTYSESWKPVREFILSKMQILELVDISKAFKKVLLEQVVVIAKKKRPESDYGVRGTVLQSDETLNDFEMPISLFRDADAFLINIDDKSRSIYRKIVRNSERLGSISETFRGLPLQSQLTDDSAQEPALRGDNVKRYLIFEPEDYLSKKAIDYRNDKIKTMLQPKIVSQRLVAHVKNPVNHIIIMSSFDSKGLLNVDTVENTILTNNEYSYEYILCLLNSRLMSWFIYKFIFNKAVRTMDFDNYYVSKVPVKKLSNEDKAFFHKSAAKLKGAMEHYLSIDASFARYFNLEPQIDTIKLSTVFNSLGIRDKEAYDNSTVGKLKQVNARTEDNGWIAVSAEYRSESDDETKTLDLFKFKPHDKTFSKFLEVCINNQSRQLAKGVLMQKILQSIEFPVYSKNEKKNIEKISGMLEALLQAVDEKNKTHAEIMKLNRAIDEKIYSIFGLDDSEIAYIESETPLQVHIPQKK